MREGQGEGVGNSKGKSLKILARAVSGVEHGVGAHEAGKSSREDGDGDEFVKRVSDRHLSWELLRVLSRQSSLPWICVGDFNEVLYSTEIKGGSRPQWQMNNFQAHVDDCGLRDVVWEGYQFTFDNGQVGDANWQSMLDRAMCTRNWMDMFPYAKLFHLDREWSDHTPIKLEIQGWKNINIGKINWALERKRKQLAQLNCGTRTELEVKRRKKLVAEIAELNRKEEQYWRQRSRALWLCDGDRNTNYFHTRAGERKRKNYIGMLGLEGHVTE
ncbi:uncharacterized protein LOC141589844 [Silene latifolia]|uniref:uncharacterized protein LOC141589844 n=1 Tax=Silene latifolia TaxID=37657 RepID=UPI003D78506B